METIEVRLVGDAVKGTKLFSLAFRPSRYRFLSLVCGLLASKCALLLHVVLLYPFVRVTRFHFCQLGSNGVLFVTNCRVTSDASVAYGLQPGAMHRSVSLLGVQCTLHFDEIPMPVYVPNLQHSVSNTHTLTLTPLPLLLVVLSPY